MNDSAQNAAALEGLAFIAPVIARYSEVEMIYLRDSDVILKNDFEKCLIELYTSILIYQISTACHCKRSTFTRFLRALPKMDDWDAMLRNVQVKDAACKAFTQIFDSQERRLTDTKLQNILSRQDEMMETALKMLRTGVKDREREENLKILRWISEYVPGRDHHSVLVEGKLELITRALVNGSLIIRNTLNGRHLKIPSRPHSGFVVQSVLERRPLCPVS